jgi:hypothetical protein
MAELHGGGRAVAPASDPGSDSRAFAAGGWQVGDLPTSSYAESALTRLCRLLL